MHTLTHTQSSGGPAAEQPAVPGGEAAHSCTARGARRERDRERAGGREWADDDVHEGGRLGHRVRVGHERQRRAQAGLTRKPKPKQKQKPSRRCGAPAGAESTARWVALLEIDWLTWLVYRVLVLVLVSQVVSYPIL